MKIDRQHMINEYRSLQTHLQNTYDKALFLGELSIVEKASYFLTSCEAMLAGYRKEERAAQIEELKLKKAH